MRFLLQRELRQVHDRSALESGLVSQDADAGPIRTQGRVRPRIAVVAQGRDELVDQVRMRAAMTATLNEAQVLGDS